MMAHFYEFFYNLDTLVELAQGDIHDTHYDDVLVSGLQIYTTSYPSLIDSKTDGIDGLYALIDIIKQVLQTSVALFQHEVLAKREKLEKMKL